MYFKPNTPSVAQVGKTVIGFNWIGGKELEGDLPSFDSRSAVDSRDVVGILPEAGARDIEKAAKAAAEAFKSWRHVPAPVRGEIIQRLGQVVRENKEKLARILNREIGKTLREALGEVQEVIDTCTFFASEGRRLYGETIPSELPHKTLSTYRRPVGVCGVLTTCCSPLAVPAWKIIPAVLCGNTVVWKPSEDTAATAYLFARCMMDAGFPAGVVNVVQGRGANGAGAHMIAGIGKGFFQKFSLTGQTELGRTVGETCGRNLIIPTLELGAKNALVVMEDADLDNAVQGALFGAFGSGGQRCTSVGNIILHAPIAEAFKTKFLEAVAAIKVGNPVSHPEVMYGPIINARIGTAFEAHWEKGREEGATLLTGGARWTEETRTEQLLGETHKGIYMQPCVWEGVTPTMEIFQQEILGPTVNLCVAQTFEEALEMANATPYGLSSAIYTDNRIWIERFKTGIQTGMTSINNSTVGAETHVPFGGNGWSGNGARECGRWVIDWYTRWQAINDDCSGRLQLAQIETDYTKSIDYGKSNWDHI